MRRVLASVWFMVTSAVAIAQPSPLVVVATTTQAGDLVRAVTAGAQNVQVTALMGAGVDPHLYQPTESDVVAMNKAHVVVYNGLHLEGQFDSAFEALREQGVTVYALSHPVKAAGFVLDALEEREGMRVDDPHFWFDPRNWQLSALNFAETLAQRDPTNAAIYRANAAAYAERLARLYDWASAGMRSVPAELRYLVTSHDAFQYFALAFGWRVAAVQGISTASEAGVGDIQSVVDMVLTYNIPVLFVESSVPPTTIRSVVEAVRAAGGDVRLASRELYSDAMGDPDSFGGTYIGMFAENVLTILHAYQCAGVPVTIPEWRDTDLSLPDELLEAACDDH